MKKILVVAAKEILLLWRDRSGLLILFIMPSILVVIITLVQENVMQLSGQSKTEILFLDQDNAQLGESLRKYLEQMNLEVIQPAESPTSISHIEHSIRRGDYRVALILPSGSSSLVQNESHHLIESFYQHQNSTPHLEISVIILFDPAILPAMRSSLTAQIQFSLKSTGMEIKLDALEKALKKFFPAQTHTGLTITRPASSPPGLPEILERPLLTLKDYNPEYRSTPPYNPVQQNVPAWAIFGVFFSAIPLAGSLLHERKSGIWVRLQSLPVTLAILLFGKILAYLVVCCCQFCLIFLIGIFLFPIIGLPSFIISGSLIALLLVIFSTALAACGFGALLGTVCESYEQVSTLGATTVVGAAAIGGIMVPVYAMPEVMQYISAISPLNWPLVAFQDILIRQHTSLTVVGNLGRILLFFFGSLTLCSWKLARSSP